MTRFVIALSQFVGVALIVAAVWQWSMWAALAAVGLLLLLGATGAERATLDR
jgi:hypothetical protein